MDLLALGGGSQQRDACTRAVAGAEPVRGDLAARRSGGLERLRGRAMQRAPSRPGDVGVERLSRERVAKDAGAAGLLADEATLEQLADALGA
jgi:hypothetical protein